MDNLSREATLWKWIQTHVFVQIYKKNIHNFWFKKSILSEAMMKGKKYILSNHKKGLLKALGTLYKLAHQKIYNDFIQMENSLS